MIRSLEKEYRARGFNCTVRTELTDHKCVGSAIDRFCQGAKVNIIFTGSHELIDGTLATIMLIVNPSSCDDCHRKKTLDISYVDDDGIYSMSCNCEIAAKLHVPGLGEVSIHGRYHFSYPFDELRSLSCDKCQVNYHLPRTEDKMDIDQYFSPDPASEMRNSSRRTRSALHQEMIECDAECNSSHQKLIRLEEDLRDFLINIMSLDDNNWRRRECPFTIVKTYLHWRFVGNGQLLSFEQTYNNLILVLLAHRYQESCLLSCLPFEIIVMICKLVKSSYSELPTK